MSECLSRVSLSPHAWALYASEGELTDPGTTPRNHPCGYLPTHACPSEHLTQVTVYAHVAASTCLQAANSCSARTLMARERGAVDSPRAERARTATSSSSSAAASRAAVSLTTARSLLSEAAAACTAWPVESCDEAMTQRCSARRWSEARHRTNTRPSLEPRASVAASAHRSSCSTRAVSQWLLRQWLSTVAYRTSYLFVGLGVLNGVRMAAAGVRCCIEQPSSNLKLAGSGGQTADGQCRFPNVFWVSFLAHDTHKLTL